MELTNEINKLFKNVRIKLGAPVRKIQLTDEQLCGLLDLALGDYRERILNFIIENNWANFYGKDMSSTDIAFMFSVRTLDLSKDYSQWFSKEVGLQQHGTKWELKKDFFEIEKGKQVYIVPAGRMINRVMWITPPTTDQALFSAYGGGMGVGFGGGGVGQLGMNSILNFGGINGTFGGALTLLPFSDISYMAADLKFKNSFIRSELQYKITAGPDNTHLIHLLSTPGSRFTFGAGGINAFPLQGCTCWYTYYDVTPDNIDECRKQNSDVILSPDQIPFDEIQYEYLNEPTKVIVRQLLVGHAAETLALIRGTYSGNISMINNPLTMDYNMFMNLGQREKENALKTLDERLQRMSPYAVMEKQAKLVNDMMETKKGTPLGMYVI